jgi:hypothetical protein
MPINIDAAAMEARYGQKTGAQNQPTPMQDLYAPGVRPDHQTPPTAQTQIPVGTPVPEGTVIRQVVGRGQAMAVVPPKTPETRAPSMAVIPPTGAGRTTIGTFVEPVKTNPMTTPLPEINSGLVEEPVDANQPDQKNSSKRQLDLTRAILDHIAQLGGEKGEECQKFYERSQQTLKNWCQNPATIPLGAILKFLNRAPEISDDIIEILEPHFDADQEGGSWSYPNRGKTNVMVCAPILERPTLPFMWTLLYLAKKYELGFDVQADTRIERSRNVLAQRFLKSGALWSLWIDCDMAAPIANGNWFRWITGSTNIANESCEFDVLERLLSHRKAIVGGVYASRQYNGRLVIQPEIKPRHHEDKILANQIRRGQGQGLAGVDWLGFGCALVHREVFLDVQRKFPDLAPLDEMSPWRFFHVLGDEGEDEAFCNRVRACSIPIWLDTQLICGHLGNMAFMPEHTQGIAAS